MHKEHFSEILDDLKNVKEQAILLWNKLEDSTNRLVEQNEQASAQYDETLSKLEKINNTIFFVWNLTSTMHSEINNKLGWITNYIGTTGLLMILDIFKTQKTIKY